MNFLAALFLLVVLGFAYNLFTIAEKEKPQMNVLGKAIAWGIIILVVVLALKIVFNAQKFNQICSLQKVHSAMSGCSMMGDDMMKSGMLKPGMKIGLMG
jgi:hypothetical protein